MTVFVPNMTEFVLNITEFVLQTTGFVLNMTGFVLNITGFIKPKNSRYNGMALYQVQPGSCIYYSYKAKLLVLLLILFKVFFTGGFS